MTKSVQAFVGNQCGCNIVVVDELTCALFQSMCDLKVT